MTFGKFSTVQTVKQGEINHRAPMHLSILIICLIFSAARGLIEGISFLLYPRTIFVLIIGTNNPDMITTHLVVLGLMILILCSMASLLCIFGIVTRCPATRSHQLIKRSQLHWSWWLAVLIGLFLIISSTAFMIFIQRWQLSYFLLVFNGFVILMVLQTHSIKGCLLTRH